MGPTCLSVSTCLNKKKIMNWFWAKKLKSKKKKKNPLILNAEFTEKKIKLSRWICSIKVTTSTHQ